MMMMTVVVHLLSQSQGVPHDNVVNTYVKSGLYCVATNDGYVYKYPVDHLFRVKESYT